VDRPGKSERHVVTEGHGFAEVVAAAQPLDTEADFYRHVELGVADQFAAEVELPMSRRAAIRQNFILLQDTSHQPPLTSINNVRSQFLSY
jgi:hypothetical protein